MRQSSLMMPIYGQRISIFEQTGWLEGGEFGLFPCTQRSWLMLSIGQ
jgi:hypothetical protein